MCTSVCSVTTFSALTLLVGRQEGHPTCKFDTRRPQSLGLHISPRLCLKRNVKKHPGAHCLQGLGRDVFFIIWAIIRGVLGVGAAETRSTGRVDHSVTEWTRSLPRALGHPPVTRPAVWSGSALHVERSRRWSGHLGGWQRQAIICRSSMTPQSISIQRRQPPSRPPQWLLSTIAAIIIG